jgi:hypothetical protein
MVDNRARVSLVARHSGQRHTTTNVYGLSNAWADGTFSGRKQCMELEAFTSVLHAVSKFVEQGCSLLLYLPQGALLKYKWTSSL